MNMLVNLLGGLSFFLFGMNIMSAELENLAKDKLKTFLDKTTKSSVKSFFSGLLPTLVVQSSSAIMIMLINLTDCGLIDTAYIPNVVAGANIGTTITGWIIALSDGGNNGFTGINGLCSAAAVFSLLIMLFSKSKGLKTVGKIFMGFVILITGLNMMSDSIKPFQENRIIDKMFSDSVNPLYIFLFGLILAAVLQSASAATGIVQVFSCSVSMNFLTSVLLVMGINIGACFTIFLASFGSEKRSFKVFYTNIFYNLLGALAFTVILLLLHFTAYDFLFSPYANPQSIAFANTLYNVAAYCVSLFLGCVLKLFPIHNHKRNIY